MIATIRSVYFGKPSLRLPVFTRAVPCLTWQTRRLRRVTFRIADLMPVTVGVNVTLSRSASIAVCPDAVIRNATHCFRCSSCA